MKKLLNVLLCLPLLTLAQQTFIPDDNFETALIALGLDTFPLNDSINTAAIDTVKSLYITSNFIYDLTGIEDFIALEELDCSSNNLYNIDVQSNLMLEELYIIGNPISALNLDSNINLTYLHIAATAIDYLDLSNNINLEWFNANNSSLDTLILGNKPSLNYITATNNNLNTLDASGCGTLSYLLVSNNNLESLNFQNGNNTGLTLYNSLNNPNLSCVQVDDANYSSNNWTNLDSWTAFSTNCSLSGCIDPLACNYNSLAWIDDASCIFPTDTIINVVACDYYITITDSITVSGFYNDTLINQFGCDSIISVNVTINNSSTSTSFVTVCDDYIWNNTLYSLSGTYSWSGTNILGCDSTEILNLTIGVCGCTDSLAFNYDFNATINDSSCIAIIYGCMDSTQFNYNLLANTDDGFCIPYLNGCTDTTAINYNSLANTNDGSCYSCIINVNSFYSLQSNLQTCDGFIFLNPTGTAPYTFFWSNGATSSNINFNLCDDVYSYKVIDANGCGSSDTIVLTARVGCTDPNAFNYDSIAISDDGSCIASIYGCTDSIASNYDALANTDDGSCLYCDINISQLTFGSNSPVNCDGWFFVIANSSSSISYLLNNNPSLSYNTVLCSGLNTISVQNANCSVDSTFFVGQAVYGCTDTTAFNFNLMANIDDGSCISVVNGCTDSTAFNYNSLANTNDGSCILLVLGCADSSYCNYDPLVTSDNGSCAGLPACMDPLYAEYNSIASCDDGSCLTLLGPNLCTNPSPTGVYYSELFHDRATVNWDNMNDADCMVNQYRIRYREEGTSSWSSKTISGSCVYDLNTTSKLILGLNPSTIYDYCMKAWYCGGGVSQWSVIHKLTTASDCRNVHSFVVSTPTTTKASFTWNKTSIYSFVRIKLRPDTTGSSWTTAGGFGVFYPALSKDKNGLTPGTSYRAQVRTWCDPTGGAYRSAAWSALVFWTQPTAVKLALESLTDNLAIYPNPANNIVNIDLQVDEAMLLIYDLTGRLVIQQTLLGGTNIIDVNALNAGIYQSHITSHSGAVSINKIVISR